MDHGEEQMELPPGFRFHPTDEELISEYLWKKVMDGSFDARAIGEVDLNRVEPWDLPRRAKMGEKEWYFFCVRDRKYPTGLRTNRATEAGYWKATGKDKEVYKGKSLVGMKKTLVFYQGRAPKGLKSNWVMHEYRLEGKYSLYNPAKNDWVICRVFKKSSGGKKVLGEVGGSSSLLLPPLMDVNSSNKDGFASDSINRVPCFSNIVAEDQKGPEARRQQQQQEQQQQQQTSLQVAADYFNANPTFQYSSTNSLLSNYSTPSFLYDNNQKYVQAYNNYSEGGGGGGGGGGGSLVQLLQSNDGGVGSGMKQEKEMVSNVSQETGLTTDLNPEISSASAAAAAAAAGSMQLADCLWGY